MGKTHLIIDTSIKVTCCVQGKNKAFDNWKKMDCTSELAHIGNNKYWRDFRTQMQVMNKRGVYHNMNCCQAQLNPEQIIRRVNEYEPANVACRLISNIHTELLHEWRRTPYSCSVHIHESTNICILIKAKERRRDAHLHHVQSSTSACS